jgi:hypothetical protein
MVFAQVFRKQRNGEVELAAAWRPLLDETVAVDRDAALILGTVRPGGIRGPIRGIA